MHQGENKAGSLLFYIFIQLSFSRKVWAEEKKTVSWAELSLHGNVQLDRSVL
jgi:hypothetical protein